jgi:hypothetical protein
MINHVDHEIESVTYRFYFERDAGRGIEIIGIKELVNGIPISFNMKVPRFTNTDIQAATKEVATKIRNTFLT